MQSLVAREKQMTTASRQRDPAARFLWLPDNIRSMGTRLVAGRGAGKSRLLGRVFGFQDCLRGVPTVIWDCVGGTIDNFLDRVARLGKADQERIWPRVVYVDMSGKSGYVFNWPLYYRLPGDSLYATSQRYIDCIRKLEPALQSAPILGLPAFSRIGTATGMVLAALGLQITEAEDLIQNPMAWRSRLARLARENAEVRPAVAFFEEFWDLKGDARHRRSESFLTHIALFTMDPAIRAQFGGTSSVIDWAQVIEKRLTVLLDFRHEHSLDQRRFKTVWTFSSLVDYIKHRGAGRHRPISVIIDELTALFSPQALATDRFAADLDELINVIGRNYSVWVTLAHQELFQLSEHAQKTLAGVGNQILGQTADPEAAVSLAKQFFRYDPYWVKKTEPVYATSFGFSHVIDERTVEFTPEEQLILNSYLFSGQERFSFLARPARDEGDVGNRLVPITIANVDRNQYPNEPLVDQAKEMLMRRRGRPVSDILAQIESRCAGVSKSTAQAQGNGRTKPIAPSSQSATRPSATIVNDEPFDDVNDPSEFGEKKAAAKSQKSRPK